jgi:nucleoside-diphosphate-sugar epimerase
LAHYAFLTREHSTVSDLTTYVATNRAISDAVAAHAESRGTAGIFVPSSGAVYRGDGQLEDDLSANPYGALKVADESRFTRLADDSLPRRVVAVRVFNLAGPFLNKPDLYALGSIVTDIQRGGPIRLRADRPVVRSYVHVGDVVELAFAVMIGAVAAPSGPFDTAGEREVEVGDLARLAAAVLGRPGLPVERPPLADARADRYIGDGTVLSQLAAEHRLPLRELPEQIIATAGYLQTAKPS